MAETAGAVERVFREERGRMLATLIRVLGDFDRAEDALGWALEAALRQWPRDGLPQNPRAWLIRVARNKAADDVRRQTRAERRAQAVEVGHAGVEEEDLPDEELAVADDRLRLIFTCCHPALPLESQVALTLRTLGGLSTEEIARAFLVPVPTMAQRLVRAKQDPRGAHPLPRARRGGPARAPDAVMAVVYLVFNEGYAATSGDALVRRDLCRRGHPPRPPALRPGPRPTAAARAAGPDAAP